MWLKKKMPAIVYLVSAILLCACSGDIREKTVKASCITDLIFVEDELVPNKDFVWNMGTEEFLASIYGAEMLRPDSETFEAHRYFHSDEQNTTTFTPPITYRIEGIPGEADIGYAFNENGLYQSGYSWICEDSEKARTCAEVLAADLNSNPNIVEIPFEIPEAAGLEGGNVSYEWSLANAPDQHIALLVPNMGDSWIVTITVKNF